VLLYFSLFKYFMPFPLSHLIQIWMRCSAAVPVPWPSCVCASRRPTSSPARPQPTITTITIICDRPAPRPAHRRQRADEVRPAIWRNSAPAEAEWPSGRGRHCRQRWGKGERKFLQNYLGNLKDRQINLYKFYLINSILKNK
jgi:hypothetical protein